MCVCVWPMGGAGDTHGPTVLCLLFLFQSLPFFLGEWKRVPFRGGRETKDRNKKLSWFSCKHSVWCRAGAQQETGAEGEAGTGKSGAERHGEKR